VTTTKTTITCGQGKKVSKAKYLYGSNTIALLYALSIAHIQMTTYYPDFS
jgi:hypothetical protein